MNRFVMILATGLGTGYSPVAPGTVGSLLGLFFAYFYEFSPVQLTLLIIVGIGICHFAEMFTGKKDSQEIVFDEIVGMLIAAYSMPTKWLPLAFILFRIFDIRKPFFINRLQSLKGGYGVMIDDVVAGIVANVLGLIIVNIVSTL